MAQRAKLAGLSYGHSPYSSPGLSPRQASGHDHCPSSTLGHGRNLLGALTKLGGSFRATPGILILSKILV
jgi:hypothetical protein